MSGLVYLALQHIRYHRARSLTLVLVIATLITIPLLGRVLTGSAEQRMMARAEATPLIYGATGSQLDLVLAAAYYRGHVASDISMADFDWLLSMRRAGVAPIHRAGTSGGHPIVGTDIEYLSLRGLTVAQGSMPVRIGEVLLGAAAAQALGATVGDEILSDAQQVFDLAGAYPVALTVSGILASASTPDDDAILTDLKSGWIVSGIGHGHMDLSKDAEPSVVLKRTETGITANASLKTYIRITEGTIDSFHLHSDRSGLPLSAIVLFPKDAKSAALVRGRVADRGDDRQIVRPSTPIRGLLDNVFKVKGVLDSVVLAISSAALLALGLVVVLSAQMRQREFEIANRLGARSGLSAMLVIGELMVLALAALLLSAVLSGIILQFGDQVIDTFVLGGGT